MLRGDEAGARAFLTTHMAPAALEQAGHALAAVDELDSVLADCCGEEAPSLSSLRSPLQAIHAFAARVLSQVEPTIRDLPRPEQRFFAIRPFYAEMAKAEAKRPDRIDFVSIVARNDMHYPVAKAFLEAGIHVVCEKPLAYSLAEAKQLRALAKKSGLIFALTHNYTGYPMVKEARAMVRAGKLGKINKVVVEYPQGYASGSFEDEKPSKIANWRMDPNCSGVSNCVGDIGTHAENLVSAVTGELAAGLDALDLLAGRWIQGRTPGCAPTALGRSRRCSSSSSSTGQCAS